MNQSKIDKSSHYLFGFIFVTLTIFSFFLTKEVSALRNTAPQVGNNDQICVGGYLYTITATNWRYQKQLQKYNESFFYIPLHKDKTHLSVILNIRH